MLKKVICTILAACLLMTLLPVCAEESEKEALSWEEITDWVQSLKTRALSAEPLSDPNDPEAVTEDGYMLVYDFATFYLDRPAMTEETVVKSVLILDEDTADVRGIKINATADDVMAAYYNENPELDGDRGFAALYVSNTMPDDAMWGWVQRDGQRLQTIQYAVCTQLPDGTYTDTGLIYTLQENTVAAIRAYGLDSKITANEVLAMVSEVQQVADTHGYSRMPSDPTGLTMEPFERDDLIFAGIDFLFVTPEEAIEKFGEPLEDRWLDDDNGGYLRSMEFPSFYMTYIYDADKANPVLAVFDIDMDGIEGPRAIRVGDSLASVMDRFRGGEGEYNGESQILYGDGVNAPYGIAFYSDNATAQVYYAMKTDEGRTVVLHLYFDMLSLKEAMLYYAD
ncbi:MAG: hypothetical protein Q4C54_01810 [Clostridia bacterium]|nr:hypothetical protein [Clostridia bacterium]